jgi:hypothetical protein
VLDQTAADRRAPSWPGSFPDLPLRYFALDRAGQCSSRNLGIRHARGDAILFLDDDDEVPPDLIERHLASMARFGCDVSSGVADEVGGGPLPESFRLVRSSDVFPTNNSLARIARSRGSGLFDLAYERGARADGDLGMRLYLSGAFMVLNPEISVLHHHAPSGGLRTHRARVVTRASSRARLGDSAPARGHGDLPGEALLHAAPGPRGALAPRRGNAARRRVASASGSRRRRRRGSCCRTRCGRSGGRRAQADAMLREFPADPAVRGSAGTEPPLEAVLIVATEFPPARAESGRTRTSSRGTSRGAAGR